MHRGQYLSIGEVSKLARVNIKSLRYYDRIGVLKPAYTDPDTGYRYYLPAQLGFLDAIRFCVDVGIPLREFSEYSTDGAINAELLLDNASAVAQEKMRSIQEGLRFIESLQTLVQRNERLLAADGPISYTLESRAYILEPLTERFELADFSRILSRLQVTAMRSGYRVGYDYGELMIWRNGAEVPEHYAYTDVAGNGAPMNIVVRFPAADYTAMHIREGRIAEAPALFPERFAQPGDKIVFQTEVISRVFDINQHSYELRCAVLPEVSPQA